MAALPIAFPGARGCHPGKRATGVPYILKDIQAGFNKKLALDESGGNRTGLARMKPRDGCEAPGL